MINYIKKEIESLKYKKFLNEVSGSTTSEMYSDLRVMITDLGDNDDYISSSFIQTIATFYNTETFVVERLIEKIKQVK